MATFFITSSLMVITILIIRFILKNKTSFLILYPLWGIVLLRLLMPVTIIESKTSIMNLIYTLDNSNKTSSTAKNYTEGLPEEIIYNNTNNKISSSGSQKNFSNKINNKPDIKEDKNVNNNTASSGKNPGITKDTITKKIPESKTHIPDNNYGNFLLKPAIIIWISGSIIFFMIIIISNSIFYKRLKKNREHIHTDNKGINIFVSEIIKTPCITGILHPSVYLPSDTIFNNSFFNPDGIHSKYLKQILAHEYTHIRHKDNIWSLMRTICLGIYWFDPFVWVAAFYSKQDAELACDEAVLKNCTNIEKYNYGKMLLTMSQKENKNYLYIKTSMAGSKNNLKERLNMISNSGKRKFKKYHAILTTAVTIILAGCGMTKDKIPVEKTPANSPDNAVNITKETETPGETPVTASGNGINTAKTSNDNQTEYKTDKIFKTERIFQDFINNQIKSRPEWSKWKGNTKDLYFSIQYATDNSPCLLVTTDVITDTNETINAFVYYYDQDTENVGLLTYLASNGTADPIKIKKGRFVITTHHSLRIYHWPGNGKSISADEIYGYFMDKEKYTGSYIKWRVPFSNSKTQLDARKSYTKDKIDTYAYHTSNDKNFPKNKASSLYKLYADANPVPFYSNTEENWNKFYTDGGFRSTIHRIVWHGNYDNYNNNIMDIVNGLSYQDFTNAEKKSSIQINGSRLSYSGKFSDEEVLFFLNYGYTLRAFILRTGQEEYAFYDVYTFDLSKLNKEDILRDLASSSNPPEIFPQLRKSKLARADFDNDGETEIALYITDNPYTLDEHKTLYMFDKKIYENGYEEYELYSYTKEDYRYFAEQVCINFDNAARQGQYQQAEQDNFFENIKNKPDNHKYKYKSRKNIIPGDKISGYNYIITDENYKNNYEFGSKNNYDITLEDDKTEIKTRIGISYNKKDEKQTHNIEFSAVLQYKGNGKFILKEPYYFRNLD